MSKAEEKKVEKGRLFFVVLGFILLLQAIRTRA
jgi:hypothetical protein